MGETHGRCAPIIRSHARAEETVCLMSVVSPALIVAIIPPVNNTLRTQTNRPLVCSPTIAVHCLYCKKRLPLLARIISGNFCGMAHRDSYLEALNRLGLARLIEARSWMTRSSTSEETAAHHLDSVHADLLLIQGQLCKEPATGNRVMKRLKSESSHLIYGLARPPQELVVD